ncbi:PREDICTED: NADH dehydrogenase [ubiquinone] 1 alpha subcomplex assembly factor 4 [Calidris pugnax]|uniref:NADH dehydrogenase [ubiquinone] 1 alpha subcomplex assembly factor 4 n=1 Tax=Calidris pugnax TaxID=198806 RepID=UPI00071CD6B6|nr:PREDICTED: NADH dehydrogenase [ubiquinone] 1 alpha subcomplex assembly factor 4 [Calidris pugnax]
MGGRLTRVFRTFNLESRARREISKEKPTPAPRHPTSRLDELAGGCRAGGRRRRGLPARCGEGGRLAVGLAGRPRRGKGSESAGGGLPGEIYRKDDRLLTLLKDVYVESRDPPVQVKDGGGENLPCKQEEKRLTKLGNLGDLDIHKVPKGKISIVEALTLLNNHKLHPQIWTAEKIAAEYSLELKEVNSLLEFFIPFAVQEFPKDTKKAIKPT